MKAGKWTILILHILDNGEKRFNELQRELGNITFSMILKEKLQGIRLLRLWKKQFIKF